MMAVTAPALKMPVTTEQLLKATIATTNNNKFTFFMVDIVKIYDSKLHTIIAPEQKSRQIA